MIRGREWQFDSLLIFSSFFGGEIRGVIFFLRGGNERGFEKRELTVELESECVENGCQTATETTMLGI